MNRRGKHRLKRAAWGTAYVVALLTTSSTLARQPSETLDIYVIDVEGGAAALFVSPSGESMLVDTGWPGFAGRDADRIVAATRDAGITQIDYLVVSHFHGDHMGGTAQLADRLPIIHFVDHGATVQREETTTGGISALRGASSRWSSRRGLTRRHGPGRRSGRAGHRVGRSCSRRATRRRRSAEPVLPGLHLPHGRSHRAGGDVSGRGCPVSEPVRPVWGFSDGGDGRPDLEQGIPS